VANTQVDHEKTIIDGLCDAILYRAKWVLAFELCDQSHSRVRRQVADINNRRVANEVEDALIDHHARTVDC